MASYTRGIPEPTPMLLIIDNKARFEIPEHEAWAFAQFLKRSTFDTFKACSANEEETYDMIGAVEKPREGFAMAGFDPR